MENRDLKAFTMYNGKLDNVEYNEKVIKKHNRKKKKLMLKRIKIIGLTALITGTTFLGATALNNYKKNNTFEYDQTLNDSFATQYEMYSGEKLDIEEERALDDLEVYDVSEDQYKESVLTKDNSKKVDSRVNLVSSTTNLINTCDNLIRIKLDEALDLSDNAIITYVPHYDSADGPSYDIYIVDGNKQYYLESNDLPFEMFKLLNIEDNIKEYQGNGSSSAWDDDINGYDKKKKELYLRILNFIDTHYEYSNNKLVSMDIDKEGKIR